MALNNEFVNAAPSVWEPDSVEAAWRLRDKLGPKCKFVAGGTFLRTQWESGISVMPDHLISLASIKGMVGIRKEADFIFIGAGTTLNECKKNPQLQNEFPHLIEAIRSLAAPSIRNMATLGGNILSTIGDSIPALLVIGAELGWFDGKNHSTESLTAWLQAKSNDGFHSEQRILMSIHLPIFANLTIESEIQSVGRCLTFYHKIGRREAFTPSLVTVAYQGRVNADGGLNDFRIAVGGGTAFAMRLTQSESLINDNYYSVALLQKLQQTIHEQIITYSDAFASAQYRKNTASNLIRAALWKSLEASI
jgi:carbon-monoxide dehydrogenase medium subunit